MDEMQADRIVETGGGPEPRPGDTASPEAIVRAVYDLISGPAENERERPWDRFRALFLPGARFLIVRWNDPDGTESEVVREWDVEGFIDTAKAFWRETGFWERELRSRTDRFGNIAQVFSSYESRVGSEESDPVSRGINSVQVVREGGRWWIASIVWDIETSANPLPEEYGTPAGN